MGNDVSVESLLQDFDLLNPGLSPVIRSLREMVRAFAPDAEEKVMYGGLIYQLPGRMFCGLFLRKQHVSVEFDRGDRMADPEGLLEGSGKFRRHLKIRSFDDVEEKQVEPFIRQSVGLQID